jgi:hypothetical protein
MKFLQLFETPQTVTAHNYNTQHYHWYCPNRHFLLTKNLQYRCLVFCSPNCFKSYSTNRKSSHFKNYHFCKKKDFNCFYGVLFSYSPLLLDQAILQQAYIKSVQSTIILILSSIHTLFPWFNFI